MRRYTRIASAATALSLTAALAACGSSGGGGKKSETTAAPTKPAASSMTLTSGTTTVQLDPAFLTELSALKVAPTAVSPATLAGSTVTLPVKSGTVQGGSPLTGSVTHSGGIQLSALGAKVRLTDFVLTLGTAPTLKGQVELNGSSLGAAITFFDVDTSTASAPTVTPGSITQSGATVYVDPGAATALNGAFQLTGAKALPTGDHTLKVGVATIKLTGK